MCVRLNAAEAGLARNPGTPLGGPPPCNSGIIRTCEDPNILPIIPYSHYYWVGGPPKGPHYLLIDEMHTCLGSVYLGRMGPHHSTH